MAASKTRKVFGILVWFSALLTFNVASHWSRNADYNGLYIFLEVLGRLTTPMELAISTVVVFVILSIGEPKSITSEGQTLQKKPSLRNALYTIYVMVGILALVLGIGLLVTSWPRGGSTQIADRTAQSKPRNDKAPVNPKALDSLELMSKPKAELGTAEDGLLPEKEKAMREILAMRLSGVMQKQHTGIRVDVVGDAHDVLVFRKPSMNDETADQLIQEFRKDDANFWNGVRLMNYSQVVFSGDGYKRVVTRAEFLGYGKDYEKYKAAFLRGVELTQGLPNESEPVKPRATEPKPRSPVGTSGLSETLQWLSGATDEESGDGNNHHTFESNDRNSCAVTITETRALAGPGFWIKESFSLTDIDPADIQVEKLAQGDLKNLFQGLSAVTFHTTNYSKKIIHTSGALVALSDVKEIPSSKYTLFTNDWFAPRFAKAFKHAVELCGGQRSSF